MLRPFNCFAVTVFLTSMVFAADTTPFGKQPAQIPGKIEAEHWDKGKAGVAYHDVDEKNRGEDYREKTQVDIEKRDDASNGHGIGWTKKGEWLIYTVQVKATGKYDIEFPVASNKRGGQFHIEFDGKDVTGPINVPDTGAWTTLKKIYKKNVPLKAGRHQLKLVMDKEGESKSIGDIDYMKFSLAK